MKTPWRPTYSGLANTKPELVLVLAWYTLLLAGLVCPVWPPFQPLSRRDGCVTGNTCFFPVCQSLAQLYPVDRSTKGVQGRGKEKGRWMPQRLCRNNENISLVAYLSVGRSGADFDEGKRKERT